MVRVIIRVSSSNVLEGVVKKGRSVILRWYSYSVEGAKIDKPVAPEGKVGRRRVCII